MALDPNLESLARPLGHVVIEFNYLEIDLGKLNTRLARADDLFGATLASLGGTAKLDIIRKLAAQRLTDKILANKLHSLLARAETLNCYLNRFIHGEFMPFVDAGDNYVGMAHRAVKNPNNPFQDVKPKTLETIADKVRDLANEVREFSATVYDNSPD